MRILGFSRKDWINYLTGRPKLEEDEFTTFRFPRRDRDWEVEEVVQVVYKPRSKGGGDRLGVALIIRKELRSLDIVEPSLEMRGYEKLSEEEALVDGFEDTTEMLGYMFGTYGHRIWSEPMNKLTLRWVSG